MAALMRSAERIGSGSYSEPVQPSGVPEISALEDSLERMRQALTGTTISRDYLDTLLNSMSDAVLVTAPDGRGAHREQRRRRRCSATGRTS